MATKFGLKRYFYIQQLAFRAVGFEINSAVRIFEKPFLTGILGTLFILIIVSWTYEAYSFGRENLDALIEGLIPTFPAFMISFKAFTFILSHKKVVDLIQRIWCMTEKVSSEERLVLIEENETVRNFSGFYFATVFISWFLNCILPHFVSIFIYVKTGNLRFLTPLQLSTPWDQSKPFFHFITAIWYAGGIYFGSKCTTAMDTLFCWFVVNISTQFRMLQQNFKNAASVLDPAEMEIAIRRCIKKHQDIIALANDFDDIFRQIVFVGFSSSGVQICLIICKLTGGVTLVKFLFFTVILLIWIFQCMILCYGGQRISDESTQIGVQIYEVFPWHRVSVKNRKMLLLCLLRAQKQCEVTGIFFVADWKLFLWVMQTSYSLTTLLLSFGDDNPN